MTLAAFLKGKEQQVKQLDRAMELMSDRQDARMTQLQKERDEAIRQGHSFSCCSAFEFMYHRKVTSHHQVVFFLQGFGLRGYESGDVGWVRLWRCLCFYRNVLVWWCGVVVVG